MFECRHKEKKNWRWWWWWNIFLYRKRHRHSSVDNLHTHCNRRCLLVGGRAGRLIYFGYARCPVRSMLFRWIHGSIRFFRCTRFHSNSPSCSSLSIRVAASSFSLPFNAYLFSLSIDLSLSDLSLYLFKVYINTYLFSPFLFLFLFSRFAFFSLSFYLLLRIIDVQPLGV